MNKDDLPDRWKDKIIDWLAYENISNQMGPDVITFPAEGVQLKFADGSCLEFRYSVMIIANEFDELCIIANSCGYHIFSLSAVERYE